MTLEEIKAAVEAGKTVCWARRNYEVVKDGIGQWLIRSKCNDHYIGLTWADGKTLNGREDQFFIAEEGSPGGE